MCQALASALGGYLGHHYDRRHVIAAGCFIWGVMTMFFSFATIWYWGAFLWAWNGIGLAFVIPNTQSLVADYYSDTERGRAFGTLFTTGTLFRAAASLSTVVRCSCGYNHRSPMQSMLLDARSLKARADAVTSLRCTES